MTRSSRRGWHVKYPRTEAHDYDEADTLEHLRRLAADWVDACDLAADLIRGEVDVNAIIEAGNAAQGDDEDNAIPTGGEPAQGDDESEPTKPTGKRATVNERMVGTIMANPEAMGWNSAQWAKHLKCGKSSVVETATWKKLESARLQAQAERMKDRRRKPKASDSRRD